MPPRPGPDPSSHEPPIFDFERLDVYRIGLRAVVACEAVIEHLPRGWAYMADQLRRAALSVTNNIAEGAGEYAPRDKARLYRFARRSATECASILTVAGQLKLTSGDRFAAAREDLRRVVATLSKLDRRFRNQRCVEVTQKWSPATGPPPRDRLPPSSAPVPFQADSPQSQPRRTQTDTPKSVKAPGPVTDTATGF